jgi:hypothetical protein
MTLVIIESPFGRRVDGSTAGPDEMATNVIYAKAALADSLHRGEAPFASHLLYPGVLDDALPEQRRLGMEAGFAWGAWADLVAVYVDRGVTPGMTEGIKRALGCGIRLEYRHLEDWS